MNEPLVEVWAAVRCTGYHRWPDAPAHRDYLRSRHRHTFVIAPSVRVSHDDRAVEFHDLRDIVEEWWTPERDTQSCEAIGRELHAYLTEAGFVVTRISVSEDGFDGADLTWT